jgi:hypothetical protein
MSLLSLLLPLAFVLVIVAIAWTLFWKFILEPNPLIRDFFDLEKRQPSSKQPPDAQRSHSKKQIKKQ